MENLEGGLDYLKQVVIEDKLGVCEELEKEMASNIAKYQCEWKTTIESPEKLKRFSHFINSDQRDEKLKFISMREQKIPKSFEPSAEERIPVLELTSNDE